MNQCDFYYVKRLLTVFATVCACYPLFPNQSDAAPAIDWDPKKIVQEVSPGQAGFTSVQLVSRKNLTNLELNIVPELEPYITVTPYAFNHIEAGSPYKVDLIFSADPDIALTELNGTLKLKKGKRTLSRPLPIDLKITQHPQLIGPQGDTFFGDGFQIEFPPQALSKETTVEAQYIPYERMPLKTFGDFSLIGTVNVIIGDEKLSDNAEIIIDKPVGIEEDRTILLGYMVSTATSTKIKIVDTAVIQGDIITTQDPAFPGVISSNDYVFISAPPSYGWATGNVFEVVDGNAELCRECIVTANDGGVLVETNEAGFYKIPVDVGSVILTGYRPETTATGQVSGFINEDAGFFSSDIYIQQPVSGVFNDLVNPGFENGLNGWASNGNANAIESFGPIVPPEGSLMAFISTGGAALGGATSNLSQAFRVPEGVDRLQLKYNFLSEEFPEFVGSVFNDSFQAILITASEVANIAFEEVNSSDFSFIGGIPCGSGDCTWGTTGWVTAEIDVSGVAGTNEIVNVAVFDLGDAIFDSVVLLDDVRFVYESDTVPDSGIFVSDPFTFSAGEGVHVQFNLEVSDRIRELEEEEQKLAALFFLYLSFSGELNAFVQSDSLEEFFSEVAAGSVDEALLSELTGGWSEVGQLLFNFWQAKRFSELLIDTQGQISLVFSRYKGTEYFDGIMFITDNPTSPKLRFPLNEPDEPLLGESLYFSVIDEAAINPCDCTLERKTFLGGDVPNCYNFVSGYQACPQECDVFSFSQCP